MEGVLNKFYDVTDELGSQVIDWAVQGDKFVSPTQDWPGARLGTALLIAGGYLSFVLFGRVAMSMRSKGLAEELYPLRFGYNIVQVMLCSYMAIEAVMIAYRQGYTLVPCNTMVRDTTAPIANVLWLFYVSKILDFMDTFFIVLGKKWEQLSFLHVYHHTTIFLFYWLNLHVNFDGDIYLTIVLNGTIHAIMYTYYFVSLHTKNIWWKSSLTSCQMVQFCCMMGQASYLVLSGCSEVPRRVTILYFFYILSLFALFAQFFVSSYVKPKRNKGKSKAN